jgi:hypothetical protein
MKAVIMAVCVLALETVAFINAYLANLKGATVDAERFIDHASAWMQHGRWELTFDAQFYIQFVGVLFRVFGESEFLVAQINIAALAAGAWFFQRICEELAGRSNPFLTIPFMLWPSMITRATTAMREPVLILSAVLTCYCLIRYIHERRTRDLALALVALASGAFFHKGYAIAFVGFAGAAIFLSAWLRAAPFSFQDAMSRAFLLLLAGAALVVVLQRAGSSRGLMPLVLALTSDTEAIQQIVQAKSSRAFRTTYDAPIQLSSPVAFATSLPRNWAAYNFLPFPWLVQNAFDVYGAMEGLFRMAGFAALAFLWIRYPQMRRSLAGIAILHLLLMAIWAAGTANYGTASRHHLTTNWMFIVYLWCFLNRSDPDESVRAGHRIA